MGGGGSWSGTPQGWRGHVSLLSSKGEDGAWGRPYRRWPVGEQGTCRPPVCCWNTSMVSSSSISSCGTETGSGGVRWHRPYPSRVSATKRPPTPSIPPPQLSHHPGSPSGAPHPRAKSRATQGAQEAGEGTVPTLSAAASSQ